jgi:hypothetical protein
MLRGIVMPFTTGLAAAVAALGVFGPLPALGATTGAAGTSVRSQEWWLADLHVTKAWQYSAGSGVTVAVLGTGVDQGAADLAGGVIAGPDFTASGRTPGSPFWGFSGTAVAAIIAGRGHGAGDRSGIIGIAPAARILSVRVTLEFNDPLSSDASISRRLPQAIADGITYAVAHGARIIDLPLDPGTLGLTGQGDPAAAGGSPTERSAVDYALGKGVLLVAPAGDDGMGPDIVNYPAAYPGVIAVGAVNRNGQLASFSARRSYVSLTAPGVGLEAPDLAVGYQQTSSTSAASGMVAGVAALIMSRFPHLSAAQVTHALTESTVNVTSTTSLPPLPARSPSGAGYGTVDAARAIQLAALINSASQPPAQPVRPARPHKPARRPAAAPHKPGAGALAGSVLRAALAVVCVLIVLLVVMLLVMRSRRERARAAPVARTRARGLHEQRRPDRAPAPPAPDPGHGVRSQPQATRPVLPASDPWPSPGGWQGGGIGAIAPNPSSPSSPNPAFRPAVGPAPRPAAGYRSGRGAPTDGETTGPPWAPAPEPGRTFGPLPVPSPGPPPPEPGPGIRVPGDMALPAASAGEPLGPHPRDALTPPAGFAVPPPLPDFGPPLSAPDFGSPSPGPSFGPAPPPAGPAVPDFAAAPGTPDFGSNPAVPDFSSHPVAPDFSSPPGAPDLSPAATVELPAREHLGFAAAPVADDYVAPFPAGPTAADGPAPDPSFIWDLAATDVFPAATGGDPPTETGPPTETAGGPELPAAGSLRRRREPRRTPARARARARAPRGRP